MPSRKFPKPEPPVAQAVVAPVVVEEHNGGKGKKSKRKSSDEEATPSCGGEPGSGGVVASKRRKNLGVRIMGGRIYDSEKGKTCHQCRQKTIDCMAPCKSSGDKRPCTQQFCTKCLLNRYGEIAAQVSLLEDWSCPRCRGVCNCSICMKKLGREPTGILSPTAKATGFKSVAELLTKKPDVTAEMVTLSPPPSNQRSQGKAGSVKGPDHSSALVSLTNKDLSAAPLKGKGRTTQSAGVKRKSKDSGKHDNGSRCPRKLNATIACNDSIKENCEAVDGHSNVESDAKLSGEPVKARKKGSKPPLKKKKLVVNEDGNVEGAAALIEQAQKKVKSESNLVVKAESTADGFQPKLIECPSKKGKKKISRFAANLTDAKTEERASGATEGADSAQPVAKKISKKKAKVGHGGDVVTQVKPNKPKKTKKGLTSNAQTGSSDEVANNDGKKARKRMANHENVKVVLPSGEPLMTVAGVELPALAVGPALQLVEFCTAFKRVLGLKNGESEALLREMDKRRIVRRGSNSPLVQLHVKLLNMIEEDFPEGKTVSCFSSGKASWLEVLKCHLSERSCVFTNCFGGNHALAAVLPDVKDMEAIKQAIDKGADGYENLDMHLKLQLLAILCDDCLDSLSLRNFVESANREFCESQKENREEVQAAKKEARDARNKVRDAEVARLLASANINGPISEEEKEALLTKIREETERATAAACLVKDVAVKMQKSRCDAVRTDAVTCVEDGRVVFKLKGAFDRSAVVLQDLSNVALQLGNEHHNQQQQHTFLHDSWAVYSEADQVVLDKYLNECRIKAARKRMECSNKLPASGQEERDDIDKAITVELTI